MGTKAAQQSGPQGLSGNPARSAFDLTDDAAYRVWRERKLADLAAASGPVCVELRQTGAPSATELAAIGDACRRFNLCVYRGPAGASREQVVALGERLGLRHLDDNLCAGEDRITSLEVSAAGRRGGYIPYTDRPLQWHTDGYYNGPDQQVRAVLLHCARPAAQGGLNEVLDVELIYIALRDRDPALVAALQHPRAMTIPANVEGGKLVRPARSGPVFSLAPVSGALHMRYTARKRSIEWRDDADTRRAVAAIEELLGADTAGKMRIGLAAGEGLISNNCLHNRTGFVDSSEPQRTRLLYRARYYQRVAVGAVGAAGDQEVETCYT